MAWAKRPAHRGHASGRRQDCLHRPRRHGQDHSEGGADSLKRVTFELGGKSPNVIFADADMDEAVAGAFHAIYFHGGQCCTAGSRLFVEDKIRKEFVERLAAQGQAAPPRRSARFLDRARAAGLARANGQDPGRMLTSDKSREPSSSPAANVAANAASTSSRRSSTTSRMI